MRVVMSLVVAEGGRGIDTDGVESSVGCGALRTQGNGA